VLGAKLGIRLALPSLISCRQSIHPNHASGGVPSLSSLSLPCTLLVPIGSITLLISAFTGQSYIPTLAALVRARRRNPSGSATQQKHFIAIGQAKAVGKGDLVSVSASLALPHSQWGVNPGLSKISGRSIGCILFVTVSQKRRSRPSLYSLCATDTPSGAVWRISSLHISLHVIGDKESPDEVIHLAPAMQSTRFRSLIGTTWAVDDGKTNEITLTLTFYRCMVDESERLDHHTRAAFALNKMTNSVHVLFDQWNLYPSRWLVLVYVRSLTSHCSYSLCLTLLNIYAI